MASQTSVAEIYELEPFIPSPERENVNANSAGPAMREADQELREAIVSLVKSAEENPTGKGNTPLHLAAKEGNEAVMRTLLKNPNANPVNSTNDERWTPLHIAAYRGFSECIEILLKSGADLGLKTNSGISAITMILELPEGPKILSEFFNYSIVATNEKGENEDVDTREPDCDLEFNYEVLISEHKKQQMSVIEDILDVEDEDRTADLFQHPLIASFLSLKWKKIKLLFCLIVIAYFILAVLISCYTCSEISRIAFDQSKNLTLNSSTMATNSNGVQSSYMYPIIIFVILIILEEIVQIISMPAQYIKELENYIKWITLITSLILACSPIPWSEWVVQYIAPLAALFSWTEVTLLIGRLPFFGVYALMFYSVAKHIGKLICLFASVLIGFALSFHIIFLNHKNETFSGFPPSFFRTVSMMTGDFSYDEYLTGNHSSVWLARVIYLFFIMLVVLVLMNLLIGIAVNDTQNLQKEGTVARLRKQAQFIIHLEDVVNNRTLQRLMSDKLKEKINTKINQDVKLKIKPAVMKQKTRFNFSQDISTSVIKEAISIVKKRKNTTVESTLDKVYNMLQKLCETMEMRHLSRDRLN